MGLKRLLTNEIKIDKTIPRGAGLAAFITVMHTVNDIVAHDSHIHSTPASTALSGALVGTVAVAANSTSKYKSPLRKTAEGAAYMATAIGVSLAYHYLR